jgi:hypothetical protein
MPDHDEIIKEVRAIREAYAERFGFDVQALFRDAKERQQRGGRKTVSLEPKRLKPAGADDPSDHLKRNP